MHFFKNQYEILQNPLIIFKVYFLQSITKIENVYKIIPTKVRAFVANKKKCIDKNTTLK